MHRTKKDKFKNLQYAFYKRLLRSGHNPKRTNPQHFTLKDIIYLSNKHFNSGLRKKATYKEVYEHFFGRERSAAEMQFLYSKIKQQKEKRNEKSR